MSPDNPPRAEAIVGVQAIRPGPKMTTALRVDQMTITMSTHDPVRPHHSRSCSSVKRLASPINIVAVSKNMASTPGTAKEANHSAYEPQPSGPVSLPAPSKETTAHAPVAATATVSDEPPGDGLEALQGDRGEEPAEGMNQSPADNGL